jgi:hypothetical protein
MKRAQAFFLFLFQGLVPLSAWACACGDLTFQQEYERADVIALVDTNGTENGRGSRSSVSGKTGCPNGSTCRERAGAEPARMASETTADSIFSIFPAMKGAVSRSASA